MRKLGAGLAAVLMMIAGTAKAERFNFVALGDTAYNLPGDMPSYEALIRRINTSAPAFTIHVGDTWGVLPCTEANYRWVLQFFQKYDHPLVYTPGDNEWTDCRKPEVVSAYQAMTAGKATPEQMRLLHSMAQLDSRLARTSFADPLGSLRLLRNIFFAKSESLGQRRMPLVRQPDVSPNKEFVENARWTQGGVVFATLSVPGSNNGFASNSEEASVEAVRRTKANVDWIKAAFEEAKRSDARAVVLALQAGMFEDAHGDENFGKKLVGGTEGPYAFIAQAIRDEATSFRKPVLLINGDQHAFVVDRPFLVEQGEAKPPRFGNITRLQEFGAPELKAVKVTVDTDTPWVFGFEPLHD